MEESLKKYICESFDKALSEGYIQVYYQPVIRSISRQLCSFEALARWIDPVRGMLVPNDFIPVLEREKRIHELDGYVIREVCRQIRHSIMIGETPIPVSINLSRLDFSLCDIFSLVDENVRAFQIPHDFLYIEITESVLAEQEGLMHAVIDRFHEAGYQVWMDDFGSGYSSLNMLKDYAFDELKLDMRFLSSFSQRSRRILTSVIHMAKEISIHTLAEGVETEEQFLYLRNIGCEKVQGFYFGAPLPYSAALSQLWEKGIATELPRHRKYYDEIGAVNFLSSVPFLDQESRKQLVTARQLNSIPLALAEVQRDCLSVLFINTVFEENLEKIELFPALFDPEQTGIVLPLSVIPVRVLKLLESTRDQGEGHMIFVSHDEYYELKTKRVAVNSDAYSILLQLNNLSEVSHAASTSHLDEGLRQIYTLFDRITLIDLNTDSITPLYVGLMDYLTSGYTDIQALAKDFAERWLFPEDRQKYLELWDLSTLAERVEASGRDSIGGFFRGLVHNGEYEWKQIVILRYRPGVFFELVRDAHRELAPFELRRQSAEAEAGCCPSELLWKTLIRSDVARMFWKDRDRRFVGVNQGFLDYYGFASAQEIVGKTDEELGWHVHPDLYMNDEIRVIHEGLTTHNIPGRCISKGENREILANKTPVYSEDGAIIGLLGCFIDRDLLNVNDKRGVETSSRDEMTGLLNSRGLSEQVHAFMDEYYLRNTDFMRLHVSIDDIASINREFGFDFGDKVIAALAAQLKRSFGTSSAIGRINGYQYVVLHQIRDKNELLRLPSSVRHIADSIKEINGTPITLYLSVGYALYSEFEDVEELAQSADMRLLADHDNHAPNENRLFSSSGFFRLYDELPISYAVYKVKYNRRAKSTDAVLFYANRAFARRFGSPLKEMIGRSVRELYPETGEKWCDIARRAALLGETVTDRLQFKPTDTQYFVTAYQIIHSGYCSFTYQELDDQGNPFESAAERRGTDSGQS